MSDNSTSDSPNKVFVWDLPTRLFHWVLVGAVATSLTAGELGNMNIHVISGHVVLALIVFRLGWGIVGGRHARFTDFVRGPGAVITYVKKFTRGESEDHTGHNPLGGWSVMAFLGTLMVQVGTGLFANDDILTEGPLMKLVSKSTSDFLTYIHEISGTVLYVLIAAHLLAIMIYSVKGQALLGAMVSGVKSSRNLSSDASDAKGNWLAAAVLAAVAAAIAYFINTY